MLESLALRAAPTAICLCGLLTALGCNGGGRAGPTVDDGGVTAVGKSSCEQASSAYCRKVFECSPNWGEEVWGTLEGCLATDAADCAYLAGLPGVSPRAIESWAKCSQAIGARSCEEWRYGPPLEVCRYPGGAGKRGSPCHEFAQSESGFCEHPKDPGTGLPSPCGSCEPEPAPGDACNEFDGCGFGDRCIETFPETGGTVMLACVQPAAQGGPCREELAGVCRGELLCRQGRCERPLRRGATCAGSWQCEGDLRCVQGKCADPLPEGASCDDAGVCVRGFGCPFLTCDRRLPAGSSCQYHEQCLSDFCLDADLCADNDPPVAVGEACAPDAYATGIGPYCADNAFCDPVTSSCVLRRPVGGPCRDSEECLDWLVCGSRKCAEPLAPMCM